VGWWMGVCGVSVWGGCGVSVWVALSCVFVRQVISCGDCVWCEVW
jgi:hypothetical protein